MKALLWFGAGCVALAASPLLAQPPASAVALASLQPGKVLQVKGDFAAGAPMPDLSWAWSSSNACFVSMQAHKFRGHHMLFTSQIPAHSKVVITVTPDDPKQDVSLYAYTLGAGSPPQLPPDLPRSVSCEASYRWDRPWKGQTQDHTRRVEFTAIGSPFAVVVGVSGPAAATTGTFTLSFTVTDLNSEPR